MEEKKQNQEVELSTLQMQYESLQEKLNEQEIVNNSLIHEMLHSRISGFIRHNIEIVLTYGLLTAAVCWSWYSFEMRLSFMVVSVLLFLLLGLFELLNCRKIQKINTEDYDIKMLVQKTKSARSLFSMVWIVGVFAICLWLMWFVNELGAKQENLFLRPSFIIVAAILVISIILIINNIGRLAKMSDELLSLTARLNGDDPIEPAACRRGKVYWTGILMVALCLVGLIFKLMHRPFGSLLFMAAGASGLVFVLTAGNHLAHIVPEEKPVIRIAEVACLLLVANAAFRMFHWPFGNLFGIISLALLLIAVLLHIRR